MILAIHQPHFMPWLGYFDKMRAADLFILLDHVQFERQNYQNRVQIKTAQGSQWLTVPVLRRSHPEPIAEKLIDAGGGSSARWARKACRTLTYAYGRAPFFQAYAGEIERALNEPGEKLIDLNCRLIVYLREALSISTPIVRSSELGVAGEKSELLASLCRSVGASTYLAGMGGSKIYLDLGVFRQAGIRVEWQKFSHPRYPQHPCPDTFVEGLSALDLIFNCGPQSGAVLKGGSYESERNCSGFHKLQDQLR